MTSSIELLISECLDSKVLVNQILRKALVIAQNIPDHSFGEWINNELTGYQNADDLPEYRKVNGALYAINPLLGLIPFEFGSKEDIDFFSKKNMFLPVGEIEILSINSLKNGYIESPMPIDMKKSLTKIANGLTPVYILNTSELLGIVEKVRNIVFKWVLKLKQTGIRGEGSSLNTSEKENAKNIVFNIHSMTNSQIQGTADNSLQLILQKEFDIKELLFFINEIKPKIHQLQLEDKKQKELELDINTIENQIISPHPKHPIIKECLISIRSILEGATGSLVASGLLSLLEKTISG